MDTNFTLRFNEPLIPQQLVRSGGEKDPLEKTLRTVKLSQYDEGARTGKRNQFPRKPDFFLDEGGNIIPRRSSGKGWN